MTMNNESSQIAAALDRLNDTFMLLVMALHTDNRLKYCELTEQDPLTVANDWDSKRYNKPQLTRNQRHDLIMKCQKKK